MNLMSHESGIFRLKLLISLLVDSLQPPNSREWMVVDEAPAQEVVSVVSYNTLCDRYATSNQYGYAPSSALTWEHRRVSILQELLDHDADIMCLQEVDRESFDEFFRRELSLKGYKGVFWPKSRAKTMPENEAKLVDGCATFYRATKYYLLDKQLIDFANTAINRPDMKGEHDTFNRVMPRDHIAVATFLENRLTGSRVIVANAHIFWDPRYADVKLVQVAIMLESLSKLADKWYRLPPCTEKILPRISETDEGLDAVVDGITVSAADLATSQEYPSGTNLPLIICGDFNSAAGTGVYDLLLNGSLPGDHADLANRGYGAFTRDGMTHPFKLRSSYEGEELSFTNYVPSFQGILDYIWYSRDTMSVRGLLGSIDEEYLRKVPGFPNFHYPSDHIALKAEFAIKQRGSASKGSKDQTAAEKNGVSKQHPDGQN